MSHESRRTNECIQCVSFGNLELHRSTIIILCLLFELVYLFGLCKLGISYRFLTICISFLLQTAYNGRHRLRFVTERNIGSFVAVDVENIMFC